MASGLMETSPRLIFLRRGERSKKALFEGAGGSGEFFLRDRAVNLSGAELPMTEDFLDVNRGHARRDQLGSVRVTKRVRRSPDIEPGLFPVHRNQFLNRPNREMATQTILEQRRVRCHAEPNLVVEGQKFHDTRLSHFVERNHATPRVFADSRRKVQVAPGTAIMIHQTNRPKR